MQRLKVFSKAVTGWLEDDPFSYSAATAYYAVFSLPALLIIVMSVAAIFLDRQSVENEVMGIITEILGPDTAETVDGIVDETQRGNRSLLAMVIGIMTLIFGATGLFAQLQRSLNHIWDVEVKKTAGFVNFIKARALSLGIVVTIGFLLLISLTLTALLTLLSEWLARYIPSYLLYTLQFLNLIISLAIVSFLFGLIYKVLPDVRIKWKYALQGGAVCAVLFLVGEYALHFYFEIAQPGSAFGAAGSIILMMLWVSYSCLILYFGAEYTKAAMEAGKDKIVPTEIAEKTGE